MNGSWGVLSRKEKGPDYIDPFQIGQRDKLESEEEAGRLRWQIRLFERGRMLMSGGVDSIEGEAALQEFLTEEVSESFNILLAPEDEERLAVACRGIGRTLERYEGSLSTS